MLRMSTKPKKHTSKRELALSLAKPKQKRQQIWGTGGDRFGRVFLFGEFVVLGGLFSPSEFSWNLEEVPDNIGEVDSDFQLQRAH